MHSSLLRVCLRSRHWFFGARLVLDGEPAPETLMQMVKATLRANPNNSVIGFKDNSSAIRHAAHGNITATRWYSKSYVFCMV